MARWQNRSMTNEQLYLAIGIPLLFNSVLTIGAVQCALSDMPGSSAGYGETPNSEEYRRFPPRFGDQRV